MDLAEENSGETMQWAAITGVIATVSVFAIAQGLSYPLLSFILQR
ncbi:MAG: MFS transporter, partial [Mesorhizobium sp.]